jgi:hypothetical protein
MKFRVFWDVAPCSHVEVDRRFRGAYCLHHQGDELFIRTSEPSANFNVTTRRYIPEDSKLLVGKFEGTIPLGRSRHRWEGNIKMDLRKSRV